MKISDLARKTGLSAHTLRYYERIGLMPEAFKNGSGHREYDQKDLTWIAFLKRLKATGMPLSEMCEYASLRARGEVTNTARQLLLEAHRDKLRAHIAEMQECLTVLDDKIAGYASAEKGQNSNGKSRKSGDRPVRTRIARTSRN